MRLEVDELEPCSAAHSTTEGANDSSLVVSYYDNGAEAQLAWCGLGSGRRNVGENVMIGISVWTWLSVALNRSYSITKLYVISPLTLTGCPESIVGLNLACLAAETAADLSKDGPETASAETTFPRSSISTFTVTWPVMCCCLAIAGYVGCGKLIALPLRTPPDTGTRDVPLVGDGCCVPRFSLNYPVLQVRRSQYPPVANPTPQNLLLRRRDY
jgi:hypothetical protein